MGGQEQFAQLVEILVERGDGTAGSDQSTGTRRMFASTSIKTNGKMFAFLRDKERLVIKLPEPRVDELVAAGKGVRFDTGDGKPQREWLVVAAQSADEWLALATEAEEFVGRKGRK